MQNTSAHLERRALSLGSANAIDYVLQFLLPVVLARALDVHSFGQYRLVWLAITTIVVMLPLAMPQSLYYFLPRSDPAQKRLYINQTLLFLTGAALIGALAVSEWNPWRPQSLAGLDEYPVVFPLFAFLWTVAILLDVLPTVEEQVRWQARVIVGLSGLRAIALSLVAVLTADLGAVLLALVAFVCVKLWLLYRYIARQHGWGRPVLHKGLFAGQVRHAAPFGFSGTLSGLRSQADQWVAAALFSIAQFAAFSVAAVLGPLLQICRQSVTFVFLPSMSRMQASGDVRGMLALNSRANVMVGALVYPALAFAFFFAEDVVSLIYSATYLEAAPVMRLYIVALAAMVVEATSIMWLLKEGAFAARVNAVLLVVSVALSWFAAQKFGLVGAALGSVCTVYLDRLLTLRRIAARTGLPLLQLQDWTSLAMLIAMAMGAAGCAWGVVHGHFESQPTFVRLLVPGVLMMAIYGVLFLLFNTDSRFLTLRRGVTADR